MAFKTIDAEVLRIAHRTLKDAKEVIRNKDYGTSQSGNWGHKGRPGEIGGSGEGGGFIGYLDSEAKGEGRKAHSIGSHLDDKGHVTSKRQKVHRDIVKHFLENIETTEHPIIYFNGGGSASGKTSIAKTGLFGNVPEVDKRNGVVIDPDEIKKRIPEYAAMVKSGDANAAAFAHEESSALAKLIQRQAIKANKFDVLIDGTLAGSTTKVRNKILAAKKSGNPVYGNFATVDIDEALKRNYIRYLGSGRKPKEDVVIENHKEVSKNFEQVGGLFDECNLVDNNGKKPKKIAEYRNGKLKVYDKEAYNRFISKESASSDEIMAKFKKEVPELYKRYYAEHPEKERRPMFSEE